MPEKRKQEEEKAPEPLSKPWQPPTPQAQPPRWAPGGAKPVPQRFAVSGLLGMAVLLAARGRARRLRPPLHPALHLIALIYSEDFSQSRGQRHGHLRRCPRLSPQFLGLFIPRSLQHSPSPGPVERGDRAKPGVVSAHLDFPQVEVAPGSDDAGFLGAGNNT